MPPSMISNVRELVSLVFDGSHILKHFIVAVLFADNKTYLYIKSI